MAEAVVSFVLDKLSLLLIEEVTSLCEVHAQVESVERELTRMKCFLKDADVKQKSDERVRNWVRDIRDVAYDIEDVIDTYILKLSCQKRRSGLMGSIRKYMTCFSDLAARHELAESVQRIRMKVSEISASRITYGIENIGGDHMSVYVCEKLRERRRSSPHVDDLDVIGFEEDVNILVGRLLDQGTPRRSVISIIGMGGLGKTTLAKKVYNCSDIKRHFDFCAWVYVSQDYRARELLHEIGKRVLSMEKSRLAAMNREELEEKLSRVLSRKRYLIVLDDIWKIEVWDDLKAIFPDEMNGSRLLFTTRIKEVAAHADPGSPLYELHFLSDDESWELFVKKAFPTEAGSLFCPPQLERLGRQIVAKCGGLPLAIVVLGGLLSRKEKTTSVWLRVLQSVSWQLTHDPKQLVEILALSYSDLPYYLKPCFLYFGLFPEDFEIPTKKLILFWIAEGFVQQRGEESLEDVAGDFLEELIDRSMIQVAKKRHDGTVKSCRIHDLLRDLALSEARQCKFLEIIDDASIPRSMSRPRRITVLSSLDQYICSRHLNPQLRSLLRFARSQEYLRRDQWAYIGECHKLLRVLDLEGVILSILPKGIGELIHLRHLGLRNTGLQRFAFFINDLCNLQTLDIRSTKISRIPKEIWKMQHLRHLYSHKAAITGQPPVHISALNFRTLSTVSIYGSNWAPNFLGKLTGLRKLGIDGYFVSQAEALCSSLVKLTSLENLQLRGPDPISNPTLTLLFNQPNISTLYLSGAIEKLPEPQQVQPNLTKLSLEMSQLGEDPFAVLERLPNLKMLRLLSDSFRGKEMICLSGGFPKLHCLELSDLDNLENWRIESGALPRLGRLIIRGCEMLKMLPEGLQYVTSLKEMILEEMPDEFEDRIQEDGGDDWYKIQHVPSILIRL